MKALFTLLSLLFCFSIAFTQNYKQVKINISSPDDFERLLDAGVGLENSAISKDNTIIVFVNDIEFEKLKSTSLSYTVLIEDWYKYYEQLPKLNEQEKADIINESRDNFNVDGFGFGSMGGYYTYQEIANNLDSMYAQFPDLITQKFSIGSSHGNRTIWAVKISDNPTVNENEPGVGMDALIHAREPQSMATLMYFMWYLLENYGTNPEVTYLVNNRQIYCIPCFNPDGYEYNRQTNPNGGGMWRKNRLNSGSCYGVDLNRNYTYKWAYNNTGSSPDPCDDTYRGPSAGSEPETQAVTNFIIGKNIKAHFNMHSGASAFLYPWGYIDQGCPDSPLYIEFCQDMTSYNGYEFGTGAQVLGYTSNGSARDWLYGEQTIKEKIIGYTYEIGDFWPSQSQIVPIAQLNVNPLLYHCWVAGDYPDMVNPNFSQEYFNPGDNVSMSPELKNKGLSAVYNLSFSLTSLSTYASVTNGTGTLDSIPARSSAVLGSAMSFSLAPTTPLEENVKLLLTTSINGTSLLKDTISLMVGYPINLFADTTNVLADLWTVTASPTTPKWEETAASFYSAPNSYTDSKTGNYANNATVTMTLTNAIDISGFTNPRLTFWTKYDLEANWDYGQVEVSTNNGSTWSALSGLYTQPGTGSFQPNGQPLYDGTQASWVKEEMSLTGKTSAQFKMRFKLRSDGYTVRDGWYLDDIKIFVYGAVPVELTSFTAEPQGNKVHLKWSTATELNNRGFEIERVSINGKNLKEYSTIGFVKGKGTTEEISSYTFIDKNPIDGKSLYRLKQIDYDGTFKYYGPAEVSFTLNKNYTLEQNYPNPFNPATEIKYSIPQAGIVTMKVYNVLGSELATLVNEYQDAGNHSFNLDLTKIGLTSGVYFYTIKAGTFSQTKKMVVMK